MQVKRGDYRYYNVLGVLLLTVSLDQLNSYDLDVLKEIGNIGAGNAATALADMLQGRIDMLVPSVAILEFKKLASILGGAENLIAGILIEIHGSISGYIMFVLEDKYAASLMNVLMMDEGSRKSALEFTDMDVSALKEITNIVAGSYLSSISSLTGFNMDMSIPYLAVDMAGAILSVPISSYGAVGESVLLVETEFLYKENSIIGHFFLIPNLESYDKLLDALRIGD